MFTWRWETPSRWGNLLRWGNPPVHIISLLICSCLNNRWGDPPHVTSPIWGLPTPCKRVFSGSLLDSYTMFAFLSVSPTKFHNGHPEERKRPIQKSFPLQRGLTRVNVWIICPPRQGHSILYPHPPPPPSPRQVDETFTRGRLRDVLKGSILEERFFWRGVVVQNCNFLRVQIPRINFWKDKGRAISSI